MNLRNTLIKRTDFSPNASNNYVFQQSYLLTVHMYSSTRRLRSRHCLRVWKLGLCPSLQHCSRTWKIHNLHCKNFRRKLHWVIVRKYWPINQCTRPNSSCPKNNLIYNKFFVRHIQVEEISFSMYFNTELVFFALKYGCVLSWFDREKCEL